MFSEFAYSPQMQLLLGVSSFVSTFFSLYLVAELILAFFDVSAGRREKALFAFVTGTLLHNVWVYSFYFIGGRISFSPIIFPLVVNPNPVMAFLYYLAAMKIFALSPVRSIKMMSYVYLYWTLNTTLYQMLGAAVFAQGGPRYNYLLDAMAVLGTFALFLPATKLLLRYVRNNHAKLRFVDRGIVYWKREALFFFLRTLFVYVLNVSMPILMPDTIADSVFINVFMVLFILMNLYMDLHSYDAEIISSQEVHISALFKGLEEFRGIKHDFFNILHTYSGYLELNEYEKLKGYHDSLVHTTSHAGSMLDLAQRTQENPSLISLLMAKLAEAELASVNLMISLKCDLSDLYITPVDICRVLSCLLDNAIEAAAESSDKRIYFTCEQKDPDSKLVIITNTTTLPVDVAAIQNYGVTSKPGHSGIGLNTVHRTLNRYANSTFRLQHFGQEFSAYIEFRQI